jgi:hypothetical protein
VSSTFLSPGASTHRTTRANRYKLRFLPRSSPIIEFTCQENRNTRPYDNDFANNIALGDRNSCVRGHLKAISKSAWDLANWLTHQAGAIRPDAEIVLDATQSANRHVRNCSDAAREWSTGEMTRVRIVFPRWVRA